MNDSEKTREQLLVELADLRIRIVNLETSERELRESEERYRSFVRDFKGIVFRGKIDHPPTMLAGTVEEILGYSAKELLNGEILFEQVVHPEDLGEYENTKRQIRSAPNYSNEWERRIVRKDGEIRWIHEVIHNICDSSGQPDCVQGVIYDIAEHKRMEEALRESERRMALLLQAAPLGIHECDIDGRITFVNPSQERITGYTADELTGKYIWDRIEPGPEKDSCPDYLKHLVLEQPMPTPIFYRNIRKNGELFDIRIDWNYKRNRQGQVIGFVCIVSDITKQKMAAKVLGESEERYRKLVESTMDVIYILDKAGTLLYANRSAAAYIGISQADLVGKRQEDLFPPEMAKRHIERTGQVFAAGEGSEIDELFEFGADKIWLNVRLIPLLDEGRKVVSVMGVCRNITEQKQAEGVLQKAHDELEQRVKERTAELIKSNEELAVFRKFAEASGQGFGMGDLDGRIVYVNPTLCRLIGEDRPGDVIGKYFQTYYTDEWKEKRVHEVIPILEREGHWEGEITIHSRQGKLISALHHIVNLKDDLGRPFQRAILVTDVTELKRTEETLRKSEERFRSYFEQGLMGMAVSSADKRWLEINDRLCEILGYAKEELLQKHFMNFLHPDDLEASHLFYHQLMAGEVNHGTVERRYIRKDGELVYLTVFAKCFRSADGKVDHILALFDDVTQHRKARQALQKEHQTLKHLLQSSDHERQLIAYEIHDGLAQQLAGAIMQLQTFNHLKESNPKEAAKAYEVGMTMLHQGHFEARRLINGVRPPILDELGIVKAIAHLIHEESRRKGPKIEFHSKVDFNRLAPILENAIYRIVQEGLANVRKHSKSEKVQVSLIQRKEYVRIEIRDQGVGFAREKINENCYGIVGIRERARLLGGKSGIRSMLGKGTHIRVELPLVERE